MDHKKLALEIIEACGGKENFTQVWHCFTRLRLNAKDEKLVKINEIKNLDGVLGAQFNGGHFQIIIGNQVEPVFAEVMKELEGYLSGEVEEKKDVNTKKNIIETLFDIIAGVFTPILPAIVGAGLLKGILSILTVTNLISEASGVYAVLFMISDAAFYFLPFLLAISSARKFKTNEYLAVAVAGCLMHPNLLGLAMEGKVSELSLVGLPVPVINYSTSVLPIILSVFVLSHVSRVLNKYIPKVFQIILTPVLVLLIVVPIALIVIGPLGQYAGSGLANVSVWLMDNAPIVYGLVIGGLYPFIIMSGMHYAFFPIMLENISRLGFENGFLPVGLFANVAQFGACVAVALVIKNKKMKEVAWSSSISAFLGITEPALYGVLMKLKKPLYASMIAGGIVGAVMMGLKVKMYSFLAPGALSMPVFIEPDGSMGNFYIMVVGVIASIVIAFVLTILFSKNINKENE